MIAQRRDANEFELVMAARHLGALVLSQDRKAGFDLLVVTADGNHIVEIKDPDQARWWLTANELSAKRAVEDAGSAYYIIETVEEMVGLVRKDQEVIFTLLSKGNNSDGR